MDNSSSHNGVIPGLTGDPEPRALDSQYFVYMLASQRNGTLYVGMTSKLAERVWQHKNGVVEGFTKEHNVKTLVYYEGHKDIETAILREKRLKRWDRKWKLELIEKDNPKWGDLYETICM